MLHHGKIPEEYKKDPNQCKICGDIESFHAHSNGVRIDNYFVVGRGQSPWAAARIWRKKYLELLAKGK